MFLLKFNVYYLQIIFSNLLKVKWIALSKLEERPIVHCINTDLYTQYREISFLCLQPGEQKTKEKKRKKIKELLLFILQKLDVFITTSNTQPGSLPDTFTCTSWLEN